MYRSAAGQIAVGHVDPYDLIAIQRGFKLNTTQKVASVARTNRRPNIILIMSDDLGYEVIGANGGASYETPVIDGMAASGM
ncbi:MAG: hypothetical protein O3C10_10850 [Chloroflexi bacterium]|nr:hypothetical protein [Chloroflexota bacterium]